MNRIFPLLAKRSPHRTKYSTRLSLKANPRPTETVSFERLRDSFYCPTFGEMENVCFFFRSFFPPKSLPCCPDRLRERETFFFPAANAQATEPVLFSWSVRPVSDRWRWLELLKRLRNIEKFVFIFIKSRFCYWFFHDTEDFIIFFTKIKFAYFGKNNYERLFVRCPIDGVDCSIC